MPYFSLPANELNEVIAPSCYTCFDYANGLADLVSSRKYLTARQQGMQSREIC